MSVKEHTLELRVDGMTCAGCAATVQKSIEGVAGVHSASVNVTNGRAVVEGEEPSADAIIHAIQSKGYDASVIESGAAPAELRSEIELMQAKHEGEWRRRAMIGMGIWIPLELLHWLTHGPWMPWVMFAGATMVIITVGGGFYRSAWKAALKRTTNMDTLIAMGATTAYVFSLVVFAGRAFEWLVDQPLYFSESAALLGIISLGHWLEARASSKAGSAVRELLNLQPDTAERIDADGQSQSIQTSDVSKGDHILIRPGGRVPVDGVIIEGKSDVDESVVTGESLPVHKAAGDSIVAGAMNTTGRLVVEATVDGRHTTISRIAEIVQRAQTSRADVQRLADKVSSIFVPSVLFIGLVTLIGWTLWGDFTTGIIATVTVLIISCPCALGLATPMAVMVGTGAASRRGILVKSAQALETAGRANHVVFDKTGTLTAGKPVVTNINVTHKRFNEDSLIALAAAAEASSEHPIAKAILRVAVENNIDVPAASEFQSIPGEGVRAMVKGQRVVVQRGEMTACSILVDDELIGTLTIADELRRDARDAIARLRSQRMSITMLTGDRKETAARIGDQLGLSNHEIVAEATPETKSKFIESKRETGTIMIGDGINDAAALAQADVGIAIASGTNIAIESADIVIPGDRVTAVAETVELSRETLGTIKQNLFFAFFYNASMIPVAAFGLLGTAGPLIAAAAMGASDLTVIGNALRLKYKLNRR